LSCLRTRRTGRARREEIFIADGPRGCQTGLREGHPGSAAFG
jgi:hypothetical protein